MSAYGHEMERGFSAQTLPSREASETGSRYTTEAGIYMSSFAAAVFISGLVTVPAICEDVNAIYIKEGQYRQDLNIAVRIAEDFLGNVKPGNDGRDVVLMDADDLLPFERLSTGHVTQRNEESADFLKHIFAKNLCTKLQSGGWKLILLSRKDENMRNNTAEDLASIGCHGWSSLILRNENEKHMDFEEFSSKQRDMSQREGFRTIASISSHMDVLTGPYLEDQVVNHLKQITSLQQPEM